MKISKNEITVYKNIIKGLILLSIACYGFYCMLEDQIIELIITVIIFIFLSIRIYASMGFFDDNTNLGEYDEK